MKEQSKEVELYVTLSYAIIGYPCKLTELFNRKLTKLTVIIDQVDSSHFQPFK